MPTLPIRIVTDLGPTGGKIVEVFARVVAERSGLRVVEGAAPVVELAMAPGMRAEGFTITDAPGGVRVTGHDARGVLYGLGRLLHEADFAPGHFAPGPWRGTSVPAKPIRGIYFATHFHNFYHEAPLDEVTRYIEELALWGGNTVSVWFDYHHYRGIDDPAAQAMLARLRGMLQAAEALGLDASLTSLANEGYADTPVELRAEWQAQHGYHAAPQGHYHVELCPAKPGAIDLRLRWLDEVFEAFSGIDLRYLWIWPYDQGGCTCAACAPWGVNGFLEIAEPVARAYRARFPEGRVLLSTWYFDRFTTGEWDGLARAFAAKPAWVDALIVDDAGDAFPAYPLAHGAPGGLPMVTFPEISMYRCIPWGGYGANPLPAHLQAIWQACGAVAAGGFPYSEGIYEDLNKVLCAQWQWDPSRPAAAIVDAYLRDCCGTRDVAGVAEAVGLLEANNTHEIHNSRIAFTPTADAARALALLDAADLPTYARTGWRWRQLYLRAVIDAELTAHDGAVSDRTEAALQELSALYHADAAPWYLAPPTRARLAIGDQRWDQ
jgi:hypothetical protein